MFCGFFIILAYIKIICQTASKNSDCKIQIIVKKNPNLINVFTINRHCLQYITQFFGDLSKVLRTTLSPSLPRLQSYLWRWDGYFDCDFYKNVKDAFNEGLLYITHFVVLHPFLGSPQILLTFTRQLTLIIAFSLEYSSNNSVLLVYIANCSGYSPYMLTLSFLIVMILNMVCVYLLL